MQIGALARATGTPARTLRFWEAEGVLADPGRTAAGYRDYPPAAVERVAFIRRAQASGLTLGQVRVILDVRDGGQPPCGHVAAFVDQRLAEVDERIEELSRTRQALADLRTRVGHLDPDDCDPTQVCAAIATG